MESQLASRQASIINLLPFMNRKFIELFLEQSKIRVVDIKIVSENKVPMTAILSFVNKTYKNEFVETYQGKTFDKLSYTIQILDGLPEIQTDASVGEELKFPIAYNKLLETSYERTKKEAGLIFTDKDLITKQDKVITYLIKKIGSNLIKGQSIMNISLPVNIFDKRTLLQVQAYEMSFAPIFLTRAFHSTDTMEKLKWMTVFLISQLYLSPLQTKPFSPIIGETFQCKIGDLNIYIEQTKNKPLTYNYYMFSSSGMYKIYGHRITDASTGANSIKAKKYGNLTIEFKDGLKYCFNFPDIHIKGTTMGKRLFNLKNLAIASDVTNNLTSFIQFNPDEKGAIMSMFSSKQKSYPDTIRGNIVALSDVKIEPLGKSTKKKDAKSFAKMEGEWTNHLYFDDSKYWDVKEYEPIPITKMAFTLPSDSTFREDLNFLLDNDETNAQSSKEKLEELQRADRKLREAFIEQNKKK